MKTTWNHPAKKQALAWFLLFCFFTLIFGALDLSFKELITAESLCYLGAFVIIACFFGYQAFFHSDDWFRIQDEKTANYWRKHPRLKIAITITIWVALLAYNFGQDLWRHFHKH